MGQIRLKTKSSKTQFSLPESGIAQSKVWGTVQDEEANLHRQLGYLIFEKKSE